MATRGELRDLAALRLREAEALFTAGLFDGCVYMCGYVVELALKARVCAILDIDEYPNRQHFKTHDFDELKLLARLTKEITPARPALLRNWSWATEWKPETVYTGAGLSLPVPPDSAASRMENSAVMAAAEPSST